MLSVTKEYWDYVEPIVRAEGFELFDIEIPSSRSKVVRLYIWRGKGTQGGVLLDDCARVSKKITNNERFEDLFPDDALLEVSSPGVNRKLRRAEHFKDAVGERVRISYSRPATEGGDTTVVGKIVGFDGEQISLDAEVSKSALTIPFTKVSKAQVDFLFR